MSATYYQLLGIPRTATQKEIKAAFKALAIRYHPDKHNGSPEFEARFKQINEAYQVLSDPRKKQVYDFKLQYSNPAPTNFGPKSPYQAASMYRHANGPKPEGSYTKRTYTPPPPPKDAADARKGSARDPYERTWADYGILVLVMLGLMGFGLVVKFTMDHISAVSNYEKALKYIEEERYTQAHESLRAAVHFKPTFGEAYLRMADMELSVFNSAIAAQNNYTAAFMHLEKVKPQSYYMRAKSYLKTGNYPEAEEDLSRVIRMDSTLVQASFDRGLLRIEKLGKVPESVQDFSRYIATGKDTALLTQALQLRAYALYLTGNFEKSETDLDQALKLDAQNPSTYNLLADLKLSQRDTAAACTYYTMAYNLGDDAAQESIAQYCANR